MKLKRKYIELMAPVGNIEHFYCAVKNKVDAVYLGVENFNARRKADNFKISELFFLKKEAHKHNIKIYIVLNTIIKETEIYEIIKVLDMINQVNPDSVIIQDLGILYLLNKYYPNLKIHASTQMVLNNTESVKWAQKNNISRVILPRELNLSEITKINQVSSIETEIFCHGAMCYSYSGLCFYSSFLGGLSANRGYCTQPCRRIYKNKKENLKPFFMPDLCLLEYLPKIIESGVSAIKIEGRLRSIKYIDTVIRVYRKAIDSYYNNNFKQVLPVLKKEISQDMSRFKSSGFITGKLDIDQKYKQTGTYIGKLKSANNQNLTFISKENLKTGYEIRILNNKNRPVKFFIKIISKVNNNPLTYKINNYKNEEFKVGTKIFLTDKPVKLTIPEINLNNIKPEPKKINTIYNFIKSKVKKLHLTNKPNNFYFVFENINLLEYKQLNFFNKLVFHLNYKNLNNKRVINYLINNRFNNLYISLPEIIPEYLIQKYKKVLQLINKNYKKFFISKIYQKYLLPNNIKEICSHHTIYNFNLFAAEYILRNKINKTVLPIEISYNEIETLCKYEFKSNFILSVFYYPQLFIGKTILDKNKKYIDDTKNKINVYYDKEFYRIISDKPVSLLRRINQFEDLGIRNFIIDSRNIIVNSNELDKIIGYIKQPEKLKDYSNFNFKKSIK